jgi:hypothetical protein
MNRVATRHEFPELEEMNSLLAQISSDIIKAEPAGMKEFPPLFTRVNDARNKVVELIWELDTEETQHDEIAVKAKINKIADMVLDLMEDLRGFYATK